MVCNSAGQGRALLATHLMHRVDVCRFNYWLLFDIESLILDLKILIYTPATHWQNGSSALYSLKKN